MNRSSYTIYNSATKSTPAFSFQELFSLLSDFSPRRKGKELKLKVDGDVYVLNPAKGVWIGSAGSGTISGLLHRLKISTSDLPLAPCSDDNEEARKFAEMQRRILGKINDSRPLRKIKGDSTVIARPFLQKIVSNYLASRGLSIDLLPDDARVREDEKGFVELILPLSDNENSLSIHVTSLDDNGKHGLDWTGGDCKYTFGPISGQFSVIDGAKEQIEIKGKEGTDWIAVAEGLETAMSIRLLTGWTTIFAVSSWNFKKILTPEMAKNILREKKGIAIAVDRDESQTGQKESGELAKIAQEYGIPVLFLVPPAVIKGGRKGADWNDAIKELGRDGAFGALTLAISKSDEELTEELSKESGKQKSVFPLLNIRETESYPASVPRTALSDAQAKTWSVAKRHIEGQGDHPDLLGVSMGVGKSKIIADLARDHQHIGSPMAVITPTKALANESAMKSDGFYKEGRSEKQGNAGFCFLFPEVEPFSEKMRSVVAHKCSDCAFGKAAMAVIKGEVAEEKPCSYILHTHESRKSPVINTTEAMLEGDPGTMTAKAGEKVIKRKIILDDTCELADHRAIHSGNIAEWIRAADKIIASEKEGGEKRIEATRNLLPWLSALSQYLSENPGENQIQVDPAQWAGFSVLVKSPDLKWLDGTTAEAVFRDHEGKLEIPLRTLKDLGTALERGTAWVRKGILHFSVPTRAFQALKNGALVLDATPSIAVRNIVETLGGENTEIFARQDSIKVVQVVSGNHGKTVCSPDNPSYARERTHFLNTVQSLENEVGAENLAVLSHKIFVDSLNDECGINAEIGHWGLDDRGHNRWESKTDLLIWGIQQLSPSVAERVYMSERQAVIDAGGEAWPTWDGERTERWYQVPGQAKEIFASGYKNEFIDRWNREWVTARLVQAVGRLRAVRRTEPLRVIVHATFPFAEAFGLEFHEVARPDWRNMNDYQKSRKDGQTERAVVAIAALGKDAGRRKVDAWLKAKGLPGIKHEDWTRIKELAGGPQCEYSSFVSGTTPDFLGKDANLLVEKLEEWANLVDLREIVEITDPYSVDGWTPVERTSLLILHAVFTSPGGASRMRELCRINDGGDGLGQVIGDFFRNDQGEYAAMIPLGASPV